jgi:hypothetical protein
VANQGAGRLLRGLSCGWPSAQRASSDGFGGHAVRPDAEAVWRLAITDDGKLLPKYPPRCMRVVCSREYLLAVLVPTPGGGYLGNALQVRDWDEQRGWSVVWSDEARMTVAHCSCTPLRWELDVRMIFGRTRWLVGGSQIFKTAEYSAIFD